MRPATILVAILAFVPLASATAQVRVRPGARVRVTGHFCQLFYSNCVRGSPQQYVGTFVTWEADTLVTESNGEILTLPIDWVTKLEVSQGQQSYTVEGAIIGLLVGGVAGAFTGYVTYEECVGRGFSCLGAFGLGFNVGVGAVIGGLGGLVLGAITGASSKTDRWQEVPLDRLRVSLGPQRDGRFDFGASVRF